MDLLTRYKMDYTLSVYQNEANLSPTEKLSPADLNRSLHCQLDPERPYLFQIMDRLKNGGSSSSQDH